MSQPSPAVVKPSPEEVLPVFQELLSRTALKQLVQEAEVKLYWRVLTPLIVLWGFIYQRLNPDPTEDAFVSHLHSGAADQIDLDDAHPTPLSQHLTSENTSAYAQGRKRLPLAVLTAALRRVVQAVQGWLTPAPDAPTVAMTWKGRAVRLLDGTTFRMRPFGDLAEVYTQAKNQHGDSYWVVVRSVVAFCLYTRLVIGYAEGPTTTSEAGLVWEAIAQDPLPDSVYVGDRGLGVYRVAQVASYWGHPVLLRLSERTAKRLLREATGRAKLLSGTEVTVRWTPTPTTQVEPDLPTEPITGRLIFVRLTRRGFRPIELYSPPCWIPSCTP